MKQISIKNKQGLIGWQAEMVDPSAWIADCIAQNLWGQPERWVEWSEGLDPSEILEEKEEILEEAVERIPEVMNDAGEIVQVEVEAKPAVVRKMVKLKAEYSVEITDISQEWELAEVLKKRKAEYPSPEEFLNAWFDGGDAALEELKQKRLEVKAKHPKPVGV